MLDQTLTEQLRGHLDLLRTDIVLVACPYTGDDEEKLRRSSQMDELLTEIAALSPKVGLDRETGASHTPSFAVRRPGSPIDVRFAGLPLGHEFTSLVLALLQVGGHPVKEDEALLAAVAGLEGEYHFVTYMSLGCQNCPTVVQSLNAMAVTNPRIHHTAVEGGTFPEEVEELGIQSVPAIHLDGRSWGSGRMTMAEILERLDTEAASSAREDLSARDPYDVLVVGAGPAGAAAAVYAARKGIRTAMVGERVGGQVLDTEAIENLVSVPHTTGPALAASLRDHVDRYDVDVVEGQPVESLTPTDDGFSLRCRDGELRGRSVVLATGARWRHLGVPGEEEYRTKGVTYCPHCDGPLFAGRRVAVIGGGNSGVEAAIDLAGVVSHVTVVEFLDELRADEVLLRTLESLPNVEVLTGARTTEILGDGSVVTGLTWQDRATGQDHHLDVAGVFVQIGLLPNTEWLQGTVDLTERGEIVVDERGATSLPGVHAAGDCTTEPFKQIVVAMGAGATAALGAFDHLIRQAPRPDRAC